MKKGIIFLFIGSVLIFLTIFISQNKKVILERISQRTITPTATSEIIEPTEGNEQNDYKIIIDEMGKQRKLYLGDLDVKREGVFFKFSNPTSLYSQLSDGHYYYMRSDGKGNYKIYRDKGKIVGRFSLKRGYADYFIKHKDKFYIMWECQSFDDDDSFQIESQLAEVNLEGHDVDFYPIHFSIMDIVFFMENRMYFVKPKKIILYELRRGKKIKEMKVEHLKDPYGVIVFDGKMYYGVLSGKEATLYSFDLASGQERELLFYENAADVPGEISPELDEDYLYCQKYAIPLTGGKMINLFGKMEKSNYGVKISSNQKYIFYIDDNKRIHRISKKNRKDILFTNIKASDIKCTKDGVYIQSFINEDEEDDDECVDRQQTDNPESRDLYYTDLDGKNVERIAE